MVAPFFCSPKKHFVGGSQEFFLEGVQKNLWGTGPIFILLVLLFFGGVRIIINKKIWEGKLFCLFSVESEIGPYSTKVRSQWFRVQFGPI